MAKILLAATTGADTSDSFRVLDSTRPVTIQQHGMAGAEYGQLQKYVNGDFRDQYDRDGNLIRLTATRTSMVVKGIGEYCIDKSATVASVPIELDGKFTAGEHTP